MNFTLSLFDEDTATPAPNAGAAAVHVRSHLRRVKGAVPAATAAVPDFRRKAQEQYMEARRGALHSISTATVSPGDYRNPSSITSATAPIQAPAPATIQAPHNSTPTSKVAADLITKTGTSKNQREQVLRVVVAAGVRGITRKEIAHATGIAESTVCARVAELLGNVKNSLDSYPAPLVKETGETRLPLVGGSKVRQKVVVALAVAQEAAL